MGSALPADVRFVVRPAILRPGTFRVVDLWDDERTAAQHPSWAAAKRDATAREHRHRLSVRSGR